MLYYNSERGVKKCERNTLKRLRSVRKEGEEVLQEPELRVTCKP